MALTHETKSTKEAAAVSEKRADHRVSVVGSGVVGQATGRGFLAHGFPVQFIDVKSEVVAKLRDKGLDAYTPDEITESDTSTVTLFTVSTPTENGEINLSYLEQAAIDLGKRLRHMDRYHVVVVRSTVVPGTTEDLILKRIEEHSGKQAGRDFGVCMNPEYLREVSAVDDFAKPWLITIGQLDVQSGDVLADLYRGYDCPVYRISIREAEMQKYVHNVFNAAKISFFNEIRDICKRANIDADTIFPLVAKSAEAMWNPLYGTKDFGPFSGMCLPKDTQALYAWARENGWDMPHLAATIAVNNALIYSKDADEEFDTAAQPEVHVQPEPAVS